MARFSFRRLFGRSSIVFPAGKRFWRPRLEALESRYAPATVVVTSSGDQSSGSGVTLREAILSMDQGADVAGVTHSGTYGTGDTIQFGIGDPGSVQTIAVGSALPSITVPVLIDGFSQGGSQYSGAPLIVLDGTGTPWDVNGLTVGASGSVVQGLAIDSFGGAGILLQASASQTQVRSDYLGVKPDGVTAAGNENGVVIYGSNNTVSGSLLSGNHMSGIDIRREPLNRGLGNPATGNVIQGNTVGTDVTGTKALGNGNCGISIGSTADNTVGGATPGAGNLISGNAGFGIAIGGSPTYPATGNLVEGNTIGTDRSGTLGLGNTAAGITIMGGSQNVFEDNLVSANDYDGVDIYPGLNGPSDTTGNVFQGNKIGTDVTGTKALGNAGNGFYITASNTVLGGTTPGAGNLISANGHNGIDVDIYAVSGSPTAVYPPGTVIQGNTIGSDVTGTLHLGNGGCGVAMSGSDTLIGGTDPGAGNRIAFNGGAGILINPNMQVSILRNSLTGNNGEGIGNAMGGIPELTSVVSSDGQTTIRGVLSSTYVMASPSSATYSLEFFASPPGADPAGFAEGDTFLGQATVTTDSSGKASFTLVLPVAVPAGRLVTFTATDPKGSTWGFSKGLPAATISLEGDNLTVTGTTAQNQFTFSAGSLDTVTLDGFTYHADPAVVHSVVFVGHGGNDAVTLTDPTATLALLNPGAGTLQGNGRTVTVLGVRNISVDGGSGTVAYLYGGADTDTFNGSPGQSSLASFRYQNQVYYVGKVVAVGTPGGNDTAVLYGAASNDTFLSTPSYAYLAGGGFRNQANGFAQVTAYAAKGSRPSAKLVGGTGDDTFVGWPTQSSLVGPGYADQLVGFGKVVAVATPGEHDKALLYGSAGNDTFLSTPAYAYLAGDGFRNQANGFATVFGYAGLGGKDIARLYGSAGTDTFVGGPSRATLGGHGYSVQVNDFGNVVAFGGGGKDLGTLHDGPGNDTFTGSGSLAWLAGPGYSRELKGFHKVVAQASTGGVNRKHVGAIDYLFQALGSWS